MKNNFLYINLLILIIATSCTKPHLVTVSSKHGSTIIANEEEYHSPATIEFKNNSKVFITAKKNGYISKTVIVENTEKLEDFYINIVPLPIKVEISSTQDDINVYINDKEYTSSIELNPGKYTIEIKKNGYKSYIKKIELKIGDDLKKITINLDKIVAELGSEAVSLNDKLKIYSNINHDKVLSYINKYQAFTIYEYLIDLNMYKISFNDSEGFIDAINILHNTLLFNNYIIGIKKKYINEQYAQVNSTLVLIDKKNKTISEKNFISETENYSFNIHDDLLIVDCSYNNFSITPIRYVAHYYYNMENIELNNPIFNYFSQIGEQDNPFMQLIDKKENNESIELKYQYIEIMGSPGMGEAFINVNYIKENGNFILNDYLFDGYIDESLYDDIYPYKGKIISKKYMTYAGQNWVKSESKLFLSQQYFNNKFSYIINGKKVIK